jgi:hypothetical protein
MSKLNESTDEVKKLAFEKIANVSIYQLHLLAELINLSSSRGTFRGSELSHIGALYDTLTKGIDKAVDIVKADLEKVSAEVHKLPVIKEEEGEEVSEKTP